ncbi:MAG: hypothetical protein M5R40_23220 [Anaerolineae bacterium]|nr:hypothetical protein [Anaerolineae bacterium]
MRSTRRAALRLCGLCLILLLAGCNLPVRQTPAATAGPTATLGAPFPTVTLMPTLTPEAAPPVEATAPTAPARTPTPTATPFAEPAGCQRPPEDYTRVTLDRGAWVAVLNARTVAMLQHAQTLYAGPVNFIDAITQGSYNSTEAASFGTHDGGGAVDISVLGRNADGTWYVHDTAPMIRALRLAGFAAWVRQPGDLYQGSPIHIHAVAVGDAELSPAAQTQLTGEEGYFRGFDGLPDYDPPRPDPHGGPVLCAWMRDLGYADLRATP